jgi:hypothetical protein
MGPCAPQPPAPRTDVLVIEASEHPALPAPSGDARTVGALLPLATARVP